jgi:hypothetical protein
MGIFDDNFQSNLANSLNYDFVPVNSPSRPTGETWQQAGMTQYRGYYYEIADSLAGLGIGKSNWAYSLYPPSASATAFFDYGSLIRLQDGFSSRGRANNAVRQYIDGLIGGTNDSSDTGSADLIDLGVDDMPFIVPDEIESVPDTNPQTQEAELEMITITDDQRFLIIGLVVAAALFGFIKK